jgi:flagellar basal body-associated protein FliL
MSNKIIIFIIILVILLILLFAYNYFDFPKNEETIAPTAQNQEVPVISTSTSFRGPTGPPQVKGPTGPPPDLGH